MKISPIAEGAPRTVNPNEGATATPMKLARAKMIAQGQTPEAVAARIPTDPQVDRAQASIRKIKMRTQVSPDRHLRAEETVEAPTQTESTSLVETPPNDALATTETAPSDESKPLSPQFAALAKLKREIQVSHKELEAQKAALATEKQGLLDGYVSKESLKANAIKVLLAEGVTYDQLTEQILAQNSDHENVSALEAKIKALEEGFDKKLTDRDSQVRQQTLELMKRDAEPLVAQGEKYKGIRESGYLPKVIELIDKTHQQTGEVLDLEEALDLMEAEIRTEAQKWAKIASPPPVPQIPPVQTNRVPTKTMRTLTNRDGVSSVGMSKRERAIAAMEGRLK